MKDKVKKVKRFSWKDVLMAENVPQQYCEYQQLKFNYFAFGSWRKRRKPISDDRAAYNVLKRYYSTITLKWLRCYYELHKPDLLS